MTDKLRKYVLPNIPYAFIGWVFLKLGTAYRLALAQASGKSCWGWDRPSARPLPTLPPALPSLTGWWALWALWPFGC